MNHLKRATLLILAVLLFACGFNVMNLYALFSLGGIPQTDEYPRVVHIYPKSPASRSDIELGDIVLEVNGQSAREDFYGKLGTSAAQISLSIRRNTEIREATITKDEKKPFLEGAGTGLVAYNSYIEAASPFKIVFFHFTEGMFQYDRLILVPWNRMYDPSTQIIALKRVVYIGLGFVSLYFAKRPKGKSGPREQLHEAAL